MCHVDRCLPHPMLLSDRATVQRGEALQPLIAGALQPLGCQPVLSFYGAITAPRRPDIWPGQIPRYWLHHHQGSTLNCSDGATLLFTAVTGPPHRTDRTAGRSLGRLSLSSLGGAWACDLLRRYQHRTSSFNWGQQKCT